MTTLKDVLCSAPNRARVVHDAASLVESEVDSKGGLSGLAVKTAFKAVRAVRPGLVPETVDHLLDRFVEKMEPFHTDWVNGGKAQSFEAFLTSKKSQVANALLSVTDDIAQHSTHGTLKKSYQALRPQGEKHVEAAIPGLGRVVQRYL